MKRFLHGGDIYKQSPPKGEWLDFSANINPLGLSDKVRNAIVNNIGNVVHYPDPDARELKAAIAAHYHLPEEGIILGNGAAELLYLFFLLMRFPNVLLPQPAFSDYERAVLAAGSHAEYTFMKPEDGFRLSWEKLEDLLPAVDCAVFGNPNNPTGNLVAAGDFEECLKNIRGGAWILVDESFMDFRADAEKYTVKHLVEKYPRLFVVQSMTKFYALPGLRLGFGVARPELVERMEAAKDVWNVNLLAQQAGVAALSDENYRKDTLRWISEERGFMETALHSLPGLRVFPPGVNFVLVDVRDAGVDAECILAGMKQRGILLRDCSNYPSLDRNYLRMAIRSHEENLKLMAAWKEIMGV